MIDPPSGTVTLLFTDIQGSTQLLRRIGDAYAVVLADHHRLLRHAFATHQGYEVDTQGDAFFIAFTRPTDAVHAAVAAQLALAAHHWPLDVSVRARMGLHTGQPLVTEGRYIGLDVHRAARIAAAAHGGQVLLSQVTAELLHEQLGDETVLRSLGQHFLKDFEHPQELFQLIVTGLPDQFPPPRTSKARVEDGPAAASNEPSQLIGRAGEIEALQKKLESACAGRGGLVLLAGEAGIGKTRLIEELADDAGRRGMQVLWGRCWENEGAPPFWPWIEILRGLTHNREPQELQSEFGAGASQIAQLIPELREQLPSLPPTPLLEAGEARFRLFDAIKAAMENVSRQRPSLLILDDLHWADKPSLLLLQFLLQRLGDSRILIVGTYRDTELHAQHPLTEVLPSLRRERAFDSIALKGLMVDAVRDFVRSFLNRAGPFDEGVLVEALSRQTDGNPLFVQEELRYLVENDRLPVSGGNADAAGRFKLGLPQGVRDVIRRRLSRLSDEAIGVLTVAAVIGREFDSETLERSSDADEDRVDTALDDAETARIIEELPGAMGRYHFSHALIRETVYAELPARRRMRLHRQVGEALEQLPARDLDSHLSELAHHFLQALPTGTAEKALLYLERAATRAMATYAYEEAVSFFEQALRVHEDLAPEEDTRHCDLLIALGGALLPAGEPLRAAGTVASEALALAERSGDELRSSQACQLALRGLSRHGGPPVTQTAQYSRWLTEADRYARPGSLDRVHTDIALAGREYFGSRQRTGFALALKGLKLARELNNDEALFHAAWLIIVMRLPEYQDERTRVAEEFARRPQGRASANTFGQFLQRSSLALLSWCEREESEKASSCLKELADRTKDASLLLGAMGHDIAFAAIDGRLGAAAQAGEQLRQRSTELGSPGPGWTSAFHSTLRPLCYLGRAEEALAAQPEEARTAVTDGYSLVFGAARALGLAHMGNTEDVRELLDRLRKRLRASDDSFELSFAPLTNYLETAVLAQDRELAERLVPRLAITAALIDEVYLTCPARHLGAASALLGDQGAAMHYYEQALEVAGKIRFRPEIALTHLGIAELLLEDADEAHRAEALGHLDFAIGEFQEMKMQPALERALRHKEVLKP